MIQHILLWTYKPDVSREERARLERELADLATKVPSLFKVAYGPVVGGRNQSFTHCFVMQFESVTALEEYARHPAHEAFAGPFRAACELQVVADFEVAGG